MHKIETGKGPIYTVEPTNWNGDITVFLHGWGSKKKEKHYIDIAWNEFELERKFEESGSKSLLVAPGTRDGRGRPIPWRNLGELIDTLTKEGAFAGDLKRGNVHVMGHSGAYANILLWLNNDQINHVTLLDATYGGMQRFAAWANEAGHAMDIGVSRGTKTHKNAGAILKKLSGYHVKMKVPPLLCPVTASDDLDPSCTVVYMPIKLAHMKWVLDDRFITMFLARAEQRRAASTH